MKRLVIIAFILLVASQLWAATPILFFSDLDAGPIAGGENNQGVWVCVYGENFGTSRGSSTISVGGVTASAYSTWGANETSNPANKACFQMGATTPSGAQNVQMTTLGGTSNTLTFTIQAGNIYCVDSVSGSNSNNGKFLSATGGTGCKAGLPQGYALLSAGDTLYVKSGTYQSLDTNAASLFLSGSGTSGNNKAVIGYPGSSSTIGNDQSDTISYGVRGAGSQAGCDYHTIANLQTIHGGGGVNPTSSPAGQALAMDGCAHSRIIGNKATSPYQDNFQATFGGGYQYNAPTLYPHAFNNYWGNEVFNTGTSVPARAFNFSVGPYTIDASSNKMTLTVDGVGPTTITLSNCSACTGATIATDMNTQLSNAGIAATLYNNAGLLQLRSNQDLGASGRIVLSAVANGAYTALAMTATTYYGGSAKFTHSTYFGVNSHDLDIGWNYIHDNNACRGIQFHSSPLISGWTDDPTGAPEYNLKVHDNYIYNVGCDGINPATVAPQLGYINIYNNVISNAGTGNNYEGPNSSATYSGVYADGLSNKVEATLATGCQWTSSGTPALTITGNASCHFSSVDHLVQGLSICKKYSGGNQCDNVATIASVTDDTHMTIAYIPGAYNRPWLQPDSSYIYANQDLYWMPSGYGTIKAWNNTFYNDSPASGMTGGNYCRAGGSAYLILSLENNIFSQTNGQRYSCSGQINQNSDANDPGTIYLTGDHNVFFNFGTPGDSVASFFTGSQTTTPGFTNLGASDFSITNAGSAYNNGADTTALVTTDKIGVTRPQFSIVDIGAYEYTAGGGGGGAQASIKGTATMKGTAKTKP